MIRISQLYLTALKNVIWKGIQASSLQKFSFPFLLIVLFSLWDLWCWDTRCICSSIEKSIFKQLKNSQRTQKHEHFSNKNSKHMAPRYLLATNENRHYFNESVGDRNANRGGEDHVNKPYDTTQHSRAVPSANCESNVMAGQWFNHNLCVSFQYLARWCNNRQIQLVARHATLRKQTEILAAMLGNKCENNVSDTLQNPRFPPKGSTCKLVVTRKWQIKKPEELPI